MAKELIDKRYLALITACPLLPISSKEQHRQAMKVMHELIINDKKLSAVEIGYGKVLANLIQDYESKLLADKFEKVFGNEVLEYLMEEHKLTQVEIATITGQPKQNINAFLKGRRGLPREARIKLANRFKLKPEIFELDRELAIA